MRPRHLQHGPRRRWFAPWTVICRCGLGAWPCYAVRMLQDQARMQPRDPGSATWSGPTTAIPALRPFLAAPERPLLTPGQAHRSRGPTR